MKIEKINDNQIRCILTKTDLKERHLKISELAYGSEKAKELFRDMMEQASMDFGFESDDIPLMIEAIPTSRESIVLVITKVEDPKEFEERFSHFSPDESDESEDDFTDDFEDSEDEDESTDSYNDSNLPANIANSFDQLNELIAGGELQRNEDDNEDLFIPLRETLQPSKKKKKTQKKKIKLPLAESNRLYSFMTLEKIIEVARVIGDTYQGPNTLWKDEENLRYYLFISKQGRFSDFRKACDIIGDYGQFEPISYATKDYFEEHFKVIVRSNALLTLSVM